MIAKLFIIVNLAAKVLSLRTKSLLTNFAFHYYSIILK